MKNIKNKIIDIIIRKLYIILQITSTNFIKILKINKIDFEEPIYFFQYKKILKLFEITDKKEMLEFGSGQSTIYFAKKNKQFNLTSINIKEEIKYTDKYKKKLKELNINNVNILNVESKLLNIENEKMISYNFDFNKNYDLVYIDGPGTEGGTKLIYNFYKNQIKAKIICIDGRLEMVELIKHMLLRENINFKHHVFNIHCLNVFILDENLFFLNNN